MRDKKIVKYFVFPLILTAMLVLINTALKTGDGNAIAGIIIMGIIAALLLIKARPLYSIKPEGVHVYGSINKTLLYTEIIEIRRIYEDELGTAMRFGASGFGSRHGVFFFNTIGKAIVHCNNNRNMVLIRTEDMQYIISVDSPDDFITTIIGRK
jgi:hypothetical protein